MAPSAATRAILAHVMRTYRAGESAEDLCRACKIDRLHTVIAVDPAGYPLRVQCDYCGSQHNYRGGASSGPAQGAGVTRPVGGPAVPRPTPGPSPAVAAHAVPPPSMAAPGHPTQQARAMPMPASSDIELLLRRIIREEAGLTPAVPAAKWRGGTVILKPANPALQERTWPVDTLFHKIVMIRNRLRTLEQQVNGMDLPADVKVRLQGYITGCYGSLTSFNVLFADEADQFKGTGGGD